MIIRACLLAMASVIASLGLGTSFAEAQTKLKIVFPTTPTTMGLPHYVAVEKGWLKNAGVEIEEITVQGDANAIRALISGQADIAGSGTFPAYGAIANGAQMKAIGSWQAVADYQVVAQSQFKTVKDLETARIAAASIGGLTSVIPEMLLRKYGVDPGKMKFTSIGGHEARLQAVLANKLDATIVSNLYAAIGKRKGDISIIASIAREFPGMGYAYILATDAALADAGKRRALEAYVQYAIVEGARFIVKNPVEAAKIMNKRTPDIDLAVIEDTVKALNEDKVWPINGGLELEITEFTIDLAKQTGTFKGELKASEVIDSRLVDSVIGKLGRM